MLFCSCARKHEHTDTEKEIRSTEKALVDVNRLMVKKDHEKIKAYARRNKLALKETTDRLVVCNHKKGNGRTGSGNGQPG